LLQWVEVVVEAVVVLVVQVEVGAARLEVVEVGAEVR
jgi:hypothetical protein